MKSGVDCTMKCRSVFLISVIILTLVPSGCARDSKPVQFYMLNADSGVVSTARAPVSANAPVIGLGPIHIPEYLNQNKIPSGYFNSAGAISLLRSFMNYIYGKGDWIKQKIN